MHMQCGPVIEFEVACYHDGDEEDIYSAYRLESEHACRVKSDVIKSRVIHPSAAFKTSYYNNKITMYYARHYLGLTRN